MSGAKEYLNVFQGTITVAVAGEKYLVEEGSVLAFPGDQVHSYRKSGQGVAIAMSLVIPIVLG